MRVLITGGAGFIGSHLSELYLQRGDAVHILDDLSTGSIDNFAHLKSNRGFSYTIDSVHERPVVAELVDEADVVIHLAAAVGVKLIVESPVKTIESNVNGTEVVLAAAAKKQKPVLVASTSEVYGLSQDFPFREDSNLVMGATTKGRLGATPAQRPSTSSLGWLITVRKVSLSRSSGCLTPLVRGRPVGTEW